MLLEPFTNTVVNFYRPVINKIHKEKIDDYVDQARALMQKTDDPSLRKKLINIFKKGKEIHIFKVVSLLQSAHVLAGGLLSASSKMDLVLHKLTFYYKLY